VFRTPVTGGNVSFYNEGPRGAIDPTPVIGMIGLIDQKAVSRRQKAEHSPQPITSNFKDEGNAIILLGETREELGGSEYLAVIHRRKRGRPPRVNLAQERALQKLMLAAHAAGLLKSAHDCSEGGLAITLAECCIMDEARLIGALVDVSKISATRHGGSANPCGGQNPKSKIRVDALLFGESAGRIVVSCERGAGEPVLSLAKRHGVAAAVIGRVDGARLSIGTWLDVPVDELSHAWRSGLRNAWNN
jgi:phosphoribosylformylglycinamidine synthase